MTGTRLFANVIGGALIAGFLGALFALFLIPIPTENEQIVTYMIGQLSGFAGGIIAYHYASKAGDARAADLDVVRNELDAARNRTLDKTVELARETLAATPPSRVDARIVNDDDVPVSAEATR